MTGKVLYEFYRQEIIAAGAQAPFWGALPFATRQVWERIADRATNA